MKFILRGPREISRNELSQKFWNSLQKFKKKLKRKEKKNQHWIYISEFGMISNYTKNGSVFRKNRKILTICWKLSDILIFFKCSKRKFSIYEVLGKFWRGVEEPRSYKIYSSGNRGVKKGPGPRGLRDEEFLVPSLVSTSTP